MRLINETGAAAALHTVNLLEPELRAVVIVKKTYRLSSDGRLEQDAEALPLIADQLVTDFGVFHGDVFFRKRSCDVCVLGTARFDRPVERARVALQIASFRHELELIGDRTWIKAPGGGLVPSAPARFIEMPVSYARAYGGVAEQYSGDVPWTDNPMGRGYYESEEQALDHELPNIVRPDAPPPHWSERMPVAGWGPYPMYWGLRANAAVKYDPDSGALLDVTPELFNHAHPELIRPELPAAAAVSITGLGAPLRFSIPTERPRVRATLGANSFDALGELDGLFVWADAARVVLTWRARFRYAVHSEELRQARLSFEG